MAKPNPSFEKRRRERAKKERREEKARRKAERKAARNPPVEAGMLEGESEEATSPEQLTQEQAEAPEEPQET